ncbi:MAG: hypothetical protein ACOYMA_21680 [Bacteroidia bacterium]
MKNLILFSLFFITSNIFSEEIYWKYLNEPYYNSNYYGWTDAGTGNRSLIGTPEQLAEQNKEMLFVYLKEIKNGVKVYEIQHIKKPKKQSKMISKFGTFDYSVIIPTTDNGVPIFIVLPSNLYIPDNKIYSIKYGARSIYGESGLTDFFKGFWSGVTTGIPKIIIGIRFFVNEKFRFDDKWINNQPSKIRDEHLNDVWNALKFLVNTPLMNDEYDKRTKLLNEVEKAFNDFNDAEDLEELNDAFLYAYKILPPTITHELLLKTQSKTYVDIDTEIQISRNKWKSKSFNQSVGVMEGTGLENFFLRKSEYFGIFFMLLSLFFVIFIPIRYIKRKNKHI